VVHSVDQGFSGAFWLGVLLAFGLRFVLRWRGDYQLCDARGAGGRSNWPGALIKANGLSGVRVCGEGLSG
jgi:hypothetical protein